MSAKQIDVTCPCCSTRLTVDVLTAHVLRTTRAGEAGSEVPAGDRWASAQDRVRERTTTAPDKLEESLERERTKETRFDEMFKKAQEKHSRGKGEDGA